MGAVGGDIKDITFDHSEVGSGQLYSKSNEDSTIERGGFESNDDKNQGDASGQMIVQMNRVLWSVAGLVSWDSKVRKEDKKLKAMAGSPIQGTWTFTLQDGTILVGKGRPVGSIETNANNATMSFKIQGGGVLEDL